MDDNSNATRVQFTDSSGSIYSNEAGHGDGQPVIGGLYSSGQLNGPNADSGKVYSGQNGILGNCEVRTQVGDRVTDYSAVRPDDVVTIPGVGETLVQVALDNGLLRRDPSTGRLIATTGDEIAHNEQKAQDEQKRQDDLKPSETEPMEAEAEAVMREVIAKAEGATIGAMVSLLASEDGTLGRASVDELATALQVQPSVIEARTQVALRGYAADAYRGSARVAQTDEALAAEALHYAREHRRSDFNRAAEKHGMDGTTKQYAPMVMDYVASIGATEPGRVLSAEVGDGVTIGRDAQGEVVLTIQGIGTMRYEDAVRGRYVVVSSGRK